ncbi:MAG TPA: neocarzinostatin apoprotein domain-containing protein [Acidimicrobiales bacterium]|nr:neocarzinostatin apoprotein domain-containing protein [Acidimicrobiales bacterium]
MSRPLRPRRLLVALAVTGALASACSSGPAPGASSDRVGAHAFSLTVEHLVDRARSTPADGPEPAHAGRTLVTTVLFPAEGHPTGRPVGGATPDRGDGPYPLIVFAHGFDSDVTGYLPLLEKWASAGFVVAAPLFPLTNSGAPGGPDLSDYVHQPGDMSFVVTQMLHQSSASSGPLSGLIDPSEVGAAGHSLGGVTTLGLVANTCCRDSRIKAAVVMSGDPITFPTGRGDDGAAPPILLVHGNADPTVPYVSSVDVFNSAHPPKGLLAVIGGDHDSPVNPSGRAFGAVVAATTDFFDRYLRDDGAALGRLHDDAERGVTTLTFVSRPGLHVVLPVPKTTVGHLHGTVSPSAGLAPGQAVTVAWNGYTPNQSVNILECSKSPPTQATDCDLTTGVLLHLDPTGTGSVSFTVTTGAVGSGVCDAAHPGCVVVINQGGSLAPAASVIVPISFG